MGPWSSFWIGSHIGRDIDLLGDLFDVTLFAVCLLRSDELWVYDQVYLCEIFESPLNSFMYDWLSLQVSSNYQFGLAY